MTSTFASSLLQCWMRLCESWWSFVAEFKASVPFWQSRNLMETAELLSSCIDSLRDRRQRLLRMDFPFLIRETMVFAWWVLCEVEFAKRFSAYLKSSNFWLSVQRCSEKGFFASFFDDSTKSYGKSSASRIGLRHGKPGRLFQEMNVTSAFSLFSVRILCVKCRFRVNTFSLKNSLSF